MVLGSGIREKPIPDPGSRGQKGTGSRIRIRNTASEGTKAILKAGNEVLLLILVYFLAFGSGSAFPIQIRIQESQINTDP